MAFASLPIFGQHVALQQGHLAAMQQTADFKRKAKTAEDMRQQIKQIYEWLQVYYSQHRFAGIPLLHRSDLLADLTGLVSLDEDKTMKPTGIPPHVRQAEACIESNS
jgi:hypothetical protein